MARADGRIEAGQRLRTAISARAWNRAQDAADIVLGARPGIDADGVTGPQAPYTAVLCKSSVTVDRWGVLAITGVDVTPTSSDAAASTKQFQSMPIITGDTPSATTTAWCVAVEPIASGSIGRVAVAGVVQCKAADLGKASGAQLIWKNTDWALITIGGGMRLGTISSTWQKGTNATVTEQFGDGTAKGVTFTAVNYFSTIAVSTGTKRVACSKIDDKWLLVAAEC